MNSGGLCSESAATRKSVSARGQPRQPAGEFDLERLLARRHSCAVVGQVLGAVARLPRGQSKLEKRGRGDRARPSART